MPLHFSTVAIAAPPGLPTTVDPWLAQSLDGEGVIVLFFKVDEGVVLNPGSSTHWVGEVDKWDEVTDITKWLRLGSGSHVTIRVM